jgi:hypothetical protein
MVVRDNLHDEARAELLCYLVVGLLVTRMAAHRPPRRVDARLVDQQWR